MTTLVIGASGLVGYEFYRQNKGNKDWHFTYNTHKLHDFIQLDATDSSAVAELIGRIKPNVIILPAAMANVNLCETEYETAYKGNVGIVQNVVNAIKSCGLGVKIVFFSTDYLFDGKDGPYAEDASPNPLNKYGKLKLLCEQELMGSGLDYLIIRTTGIFGWEMQRKNFMYRVIDTLSAGKELVVPNDQIANPTYVRDLISAVLKLLELNQNGVFNVSGPEWLDREQLSHKMAKFFGLNEALIIGRATSTFNNLAPRPLKAGFRLDKIHSLGIKMRTVEQALADMQTRKSEDDRYSNST